MLSSKIAITESPLSKTKLESMGIITLVVDVANVDDATRLVVVTDAVDVPTLILIEGENDPLFFA